MRIHDDTLATNAIFRNNLNNPCLKVGHDFFKIVSINNYNQDKLEHVEESDLSIEVILENVIGSDVEFKCAIEFDDIETEDDKFHTVICMLEKRKSYWDCDDVRDYNVELISESVKKCIRSLSCKYMGVHIVANWEDGSSDAVVLPLYRLQDFIREFPEAERRDVMNFYEGRRDGFVCRKWKDDNGDVVTDTAYYAMDYNVNNLEECLFEDDKNSLTISMKIESIFKDK